MGYWDDKVVLITGGSSGIGKATALRFLKEGTVVFINGRDEHKLNQAKASFKKFEDKVFSITADISKVDDCTKLINTVINNAPRLDVLVNAAGVYFEGLIEEMTEDLWNKIIDTNLKGTFFVSKFAIKELEKTKGAIINISSDSGLVGSSKVSIYCTSKGGVNLLTKALAIELAPKSIRVNAVCPVEVNTPMLEQAYKKYGKGNRTLYYKSILSNYPQGKSARFVKPQEVAEAIFYLASPAAAPITGTCLPLDFGITAGY